MLLPGIPVGRSTAAGPQWAACCRCRTQPELEVEQEPGLGAGRPLLLQPGAAAAAAAGTQKLFPDPPIASSL